LGGAESPIMNLCITPSNRAYIIRLAVPPLLFIYSSAGSIAAESYQKYYR
jgi:FMN-dependent NADH-azoreductase